MKHFLLAALGLSLLTGCNTEQTKTQTSEESDEKALTERVRPAASGGTSAAYFVYKNELNISDTLLAVSSSIAGMTQIHESYTTEDGMMGMREQEQLIIEPGESIQFKQGGIHVMLMGLNQDLAIGDTAKIVLEFTQSGAVSKILPVLQ